MRRTYTCIACGYVSNAEVLPGEPDANPAPGDVAICFACGTIYKYDGAMNRVRAPRHALSHEVLADIEPFERYRQAAMAGCRVEDGKIVPDGPW